MQCMHWPSNSEQAKQNQNKFLNMAASFVGFLLIEQFILVKIKWNWIQGNEVVFRNSVVQNYCCSESYKTNEVEGKVSSTMLGQKSTTNKTQF
jgi:hypothetical protein